MAIIESELKKYGLKKKEGEHIESKYGTIEKFLNAFLNDEILGKDDNKLANKCTINGIDVDNNPNSFMYEKFIDVVMPAKYHIDLIIFSSKTIDEVLRETLEPEEYNMIVYRYGLITGEKATYEKVGNKYSWDPKKVKQMEAKALIKLRTPEKLDKLFWEWGILKDNEFLTQDERDKLSELDEIFKDIRLKNRDINELDAGVFERLMELKSELKQRKEETKKFNEQSANEAKETSETVKTPIKDLNLSVRIYNTLCRSGINSVDDLIGKTAKQLQDVTNLGPKSYEEVMDKLTEMGLNLKEEKKEKVQVQESNSIADLNFSIRIYNLLRRHGINSVGDLIGYTAKQLQDVTNLGPKSYEEVMDKLTEMGLKLKEENIEELAMIAKNEEQIAKNDAEIKQALIQRILEQQKTVAEQQAQIQELKGSREGVTNE